MVKAWTLNAYSSIVANLSLATASPKIENDQRGYRVAQEQKFAQRLENTYPIVELAEYQVYKLP